MQKEATDLIEKLRKFIFALPDETKPAAVGEALSFHLIIIVGYLLSQLKEEEAREQQLNYIINSLYERIKHKAWEREKPDEIAGEEKDKYRGFLH